MPVVTVLRILRWKEQGYSTNFKASMGYIARLV
jgi:hypothetical protein